MLIRNILLRASILSIIFWGLFLYADYQWQAVLKQAVSEKQGMYNELYGPLLFFRPIFLYGAFISSLVSAGLSMYVLKTDNENT